MSLTMVAVTTFTLSVQENPFTVCLGGMSLF